MTTPRALRQRIHLLEGGLTLVQTKMSSANVYLLHRERRAILVDTGNTGDLPAIEALLRAHDLETRSLAAVVLTHGHADHAGGARQLQDAGIPIMAGRADANLLAQGHNGPLRAQTSFARLLRRLIEDGFLPVLPDLWVDAPGTLERFGFADVLVEPLAGHTPGSLVLTVPGNAVVAGDIILGGRFNGVLWADRPQVHYFHDDAAANWRNIRLLLARGTRRFFVGHGGHLEADTVRAWVDGALPPDRTQPPRSRRTA